MKFDPSPSARTLLVAGDPAIEVVLRRSSRARRLTLRVARLGGTVTLTVPRGVSEAEMRRFVDMRAEWLRRHLTAAVAPVPVVAGTHLPVAGVERRLVLGNGRRVGLEPEALIVPGPPGSVGRRAEAWLKAQARDWLAARADLHARALGRRYTQLALRDTKSRWGSCSSAGRLMFSWRLAMAPPAVLDYVAAHEVAHLVEMNHAPRFWALVEQLYGDTDTPRRWLRTHGGALHKYRFTADTPAAVPVEG